jgi:hypothetical protein
MCHVLLTRPKSEPAQRIGPSIGPSAVRNGKMPASSQENYISINAFKRMKKKEKKQNAGQPLQALTADESVSEDSLSVVFEDHTPDTQGWVAFNLLKSGEMVSLP